MFILSDPAPLLLGDEPIYRDGEMVGRTTSGSFGDTIGRSIANGYVQNQQGVDSVYVGSGNYEIEIGSERWPATVSLKPLYDPSGNRVRS